jgi:hypothetical protein
LLLIATLGALHAPQNHKQVDRCAQAPGVAPGISPISIVKRKAGFKNLTGADAFFTDLRADPSEQPPPLRIATVVNVEAALSYLRAVIAPYLLIPGLIELGRPDTHLSVIAQQLNTDLDALVANISGMAFKESRDLSLAQSAKRTPQDRLMRLWNQSAAEVEVGGDRGNTIVHNVLIIGRCINSRINDFKARYASKFSSQRLSGFTPGV